MKWAPGNGSKSGNATPVPQHDRDFDDEAEAWFARKVHRPISDLYQYYIVELLLRQTPLPPSKDGRHITLRLPTRHDKPLVDERRSGPHHHYVGNSIRSSRYTIWDFLPKQFLFQATRLHNFYFICIGVPQTIPGLSTTGNYSTILPLTFFILLTIVKEAYDDWRRHRLDEVENKQIARVLKERKEGDVGHGETLTRSLTRTLSLSNVIPWLSKTRAEEVVEEKEVDDDAELEWAKTKWRGIKVGDIVRLYRDDAIPADVALLYADNESGIAYVETIALDGETNLKSKQAPHAFQQQCRNISGIRSTGSADFVTEDPNRDLYDFNGRCTINNSTTLPLTLNEVLFRGSVLRNTPYAIGLVVNTGEECKIRMNANHHPKAKKPRLERQANYIVLTLIVYVVVLSVGVSMGYVKWHHDYESHAWYLADFGAYVGFDEIIVGFLIMFNNVIPLALYVSLEIVKIGQMMMVHRDPEMYDEESDTPMVCNTNTILENLGQVGYVLTDKTGTLTENVMRFRGMSVGGLRVTHGLDEEDEVEVGEGVAHGSVRRVQMEEQAVGGVERVMDEKKPSFTIEGRELSLPDETSAFERPPRPSLPQRQSSSAFSRRSARPVTDTLTSEDLIRYIQDHPNAAISQRAQDFILAMALCHTALPETNKEGEIEFQASSPDELALLKAAQDLGYLLVQRSSQTITLLHTPSSDGRQERETYEILDVIEFSSKRKRMSMLVRCPDGRIWLLCKGADSVIVPRLQQAAEAGEVRRSVQVEREQRRRSMQLERGSLSARPSMAISRAGSSMDIRPADLKRATLDVPKKSHEVRVQTRSLDVPGRRSTALSDMLDSAEGTDDATVFTRCFKHMDNFATQGLRTLLFAHKTISEAEYASWKRLYTEATTSLADRQDRIEAAAEKIEQGLDLLGASAIEDKLQKGVPETIDKLRRANIKIWMLTGDKRETAINIAHSARICKPESELYIIDSTKTDLETQIKDVSMDVKAGCPHSVVVIDGHTLAVVDEDRALKSAFYALIPLVDSVICCRASPAQKAGIVKAIRVRIPSALTLAIGDGANDIAMIQSSHVGVGISGKEGLQAARVADYSIAQFRFLQRLLLVHGRWCYVRTAKFILWTFWKEMFFYMVQALYQHTNGYTGTSLYENWSLTVLNTLFTSLCVIVPGIFEQDLSADTLLAVPELYVHGQRNSGLNLTKYLRWVVLATVEGMIVWWISWAAFGVFDKTSDNGLFALGDLCFSTAIMWTNIKLMMLETHCKTLIVFNSFMITICGWWVWNGFMCGIYSDNLSPYDVKGGFSSTFGNDPIWWLTLVAALAVMVVMELGYKSVKQTLLVSGHWSLWKRRFGRGWKGAEQDDDVDVGLWQAMEKDPAVMTMLERPDEDDDGSRADDVDVSL